MSPKWTKEYEQFQFIQGNRPIEQPKIKELKKAILRKNMIADHPVLVNKKMEIIDGQHRFIVLRELNLPIGYKFSEFEYTIEDIISLNQNQTRWSVKAFLLAFSEKGNENYKRLLKDTIKHQLPPSVIFQIVRNHTDLITVKNGTLKYSEQDSTQVDSFMKEISIFKTYSFWKDWRFVRAFRRLKGKPGFDLQIMEKQISSYSDKLTKKTSWPAYYLALLALNNYNRNKENHIRLDPDDVEGWVKS